MISKRTKSRDPHAERQLLITWGAFLNVLSGVEDCTPDYPDAQFFVGLALGRLEVAVATTGLDSVRAILLQDHFVALLAILKAKDEMIKTFDDPLPSGAAFDFLWQSFMEIDIPTPKSWGNFMMTRRSAGQFENMDIPEC